MASTATNKQPMLVDRVLHYVVNLDKAINPTIDIIGTNEAVLLVNAISTDGAIIEDIYSIGRDDIAAETINLYMSLSFDYLRPGEGVLIGQLTGPTTAGQVVHWSQAPFTLAPVPQVGTEPRNRALYLPKGRALWAARQSSTVLSNAPLLGCQGGWF